MMVELATLLGKALFYIGFPGVVWRRPNLFLLWLPLVPACGLWVEVLAYPKEYSFLLPYVEIGLGILFLAGWYGWKWQSLTGRILFLLPITALPSMVNASGHRLFSLIIVFGLMAGGPIYDYLRVNMESVIRQKQFDKVVLLWTILNIVIRGHDAAKLASDVIYQRGGGVWGSNHFGGIMLLLIPLVSSNRIVGFTILVLLLNFSRGIFLGLFVMGVVWAVLVDYRAFLKAIAGLIAATGLLLALAGSDRRDQIQSFFIERVAHQGMKWSDIQGSDITGRVSSDPRVAIQATSLDIARDSKYLGVGLGGFSFAMRERGFDIVYSNAHNLYLTALAEGGFLFFLAVLGILGFGLYQSWITSKKIFAGLVAWAVYGLYSGEIYEAARFVTFSDYYYLVAVLAYMAYQAAKRQETEVY